MDVRQRRRAERHARGQAVEAQQLRLALVEEQVHRPHVLHQALLLRQRRRQLRLQLRLARLPARNASRGEQAHATQGCSTCNNRQQGLLPADHAQIMI